MNLPVRVPRIAAPGARIVVESVEVTEGTSLTVGAKLMDLRIGQLRVSLLAETGGVARDIRPAAGDTLTADRIILWIESSDPPPLDPGVHAAPQTPPSPPDPHEIRFALPSELLPVRIPRVSRVLARPGEAIRTGDALLEVSMSPILFEWPSPLEGVIVDLLVRPGDELAESIPIARFHGARTAPRTPAAPPPVPAPPARAEIPDLSLADFRRAAEALRSPVAELASLVASAGLANGAELLRAEIARVAGCRFTMAVVGEFKRGKSTFLNALAGTEFLPNDVIPCTAFSCRFQYGETVQLILVRPDGSHETSPFTAVPQIVAELNRLTRDPQTSLREAIVRLPLELCRDGVDLIDTPGLNDSEAMNQVTLSVLPNVDAAVLLLIPESPVSDTERRFLEDHLLARDIGRILFVLTAKDRVPPGQLDRLAEYIRGQIARILESRGRDSGAPLLRVSSRMELANPGSQESGFPELRDEIGHLIFRERGRLLLVQMLQRIRRAASDASAAVQLRLTQLASSRESFHASLQAVERQLDVTSLNAGELRRRLMEAQAAAEQCAVTEARRLHLALLGMAESLPREITPALIQLGADAIKLTLGSLLQHHAGKLYQMALNSLLADIQRRYEPIAQAIRQFFDKAGRRDLASIQVPPGEIEFQGGFIIRIDLSVDALSWLFLAESAQSLFSGGAWASGWTASLEARAVARLQENYAGAIHQQVQLKASVAMLTEKLAGFVRRPFNDLLRKLDQELQVLLDDSRATLAALRGSASGDSNQSDWDTLNANIRAAADRCEGLIFARQGDQPPNAAI